MEVSLKYAYLIMVAPFAFVWLALFIFSPRTRGRQLPRSLKCSFFGPVLNQLYLLDYWHPESALSFQLGPVQIMAEDFLFAFCFSGIATVVYPIIFRKDPKETEREVSLERMLTALFSIPFVSLVLFWIVGMNSILASSMGFCVAASILMQSVEFDEKMIVASWTTGVMMAVLMFFIYGAGFILVSNLEEVLQNWWKLYGLSLGKRVLKIPATQLLWAYCFGLFGGITLNFPLKFKAK